MSRKGVAGTLVVALIAALALGAMPADAKKKKKKKPALAPVTVATGSASTSASDQIGRATATCPGNMIALGGGFTSETASQGGTLSDLYIMFESRRASVNSWTASGMRLDSGPPGNSITVTASAYCLPPKVKQAKTKKAVAAKKKKKKVKRINVTEVTATGPSVPTPESSSATASCPPNTKLVSGGFSSSPTPTTSAFPVFYQDYPSASGSWTAAMVTGNGSPRNATAYAYCATNVQLPQTVSGSAPANGSSATPVFSSATSSTCPTRTRLLGGGFNNTLPTSGGSVILVLESLATGASWRENTLNLSNVPGSLTVIGSCA